MPSKHKILVIEDEIDFLKPLLELLELEGYAATGIQSIAEYKNWIIKNQSEIILLDRNLPDGDGLELLREIKKNMPLTPVILVTGAGTTKNRIEGIDADADYYLVKPIITEELMAILKKLSLKVSMSQASADSWRLNQTTWTLVSPQKTYIKLTRNEIKILSNFLNRPGIVIPRNEIIRSLDEKPEYYDIRRLEITLRRLRKKISDSGSDHFPLTTIYGIGYSFNGLIDHALD